MNRFLRGSQARSAACACRVRCACLLCCALFSLLLAGCSANKITLTRSPAPSFTPPTYTSTAVPPSVTPSPTSTMTQVPASTPTWTPVPASPTPVSLDQTENLLVMGVDHRDGDPDPTWRTDTIMVVAVDQKAGQVGVISIPRDLYVDIPGLGKARINEADFYGEVTGYPGGGPALLRRTLTETLGIPTQHYVHVQMNGLVQLVDTLGGVTVTLDCPLYERTPDPTSPNGMADWSLPVGPVLLDGASTKKFATYRYATSDFGRAARQQQLIWAIRDRALQLDVIPRIPELWKVLSDSFQTDLGLLDFVRLARLGAALQSDRVHGLVFSTDALDYYVTEEGAWVLTIKDSAKLEAEKQHLFEAHALAAWNTSAAGEGGQCPLPPTPPPTFTATPTGAAGEVAPTSTPTTIPPTQVEQTPGSQPSLAPVATPNPTGTPIPPHAPTSSPSLTPKPAG